MNVKELRKMIKDIPDDVDILYSDPNFSGEYHIKPETYNFHVDMENNRILIDFPFESAVE